MSEATDFVAELVEITTAPEAPEADAPGGGNESPPAEEVTTDPIEEQPKPEADPENPPKPKEEGQDSIVKQSVKDLEKVLGRKLSDNEAFEELAKSHLEAAPKIESLQAQIKDLVPFYRSVEQIKAHPRYAEIEAILNGTDPPPVETVEEFPSDDVVPPAVAKEMKEMRAKLAKLEEEQQTKSQEDIDRANAATRESVKAWAQKKGNEEFNSMLTAYWQEAELNPRVEMPAKLRQFCKLTSGADAVGYDEAWGVLNKEMLIERLKRQIAEEQTKKPKLPGVGAGKPKADVNPDDLDDPEDRINAAVERAKKGT